MSYEPPLDNCFKEAQALACDLASAFDAKQVHLKQVKFRIFAKGLHAQTSDGGKHGESKRAAFFESIEDLNLGVAQAALVDVRLVAEANPIGASEARVVVGLTIHFDFFGAFDCAAGVAANRCGNVVQHVAFKLNVGQTLLNDALDFVVAVGDKINNGETVFEGSKQTIHFSRCEDEAHLGEVEAVFNVLIVVVNDAFLLGVEDGEESNNKLAGKFVALVQQDAALSILHLRHELLEKHFFVLDAAAVDLVEGLLASGTNGAGELGLADASLTVEHQERQNASFLVSVQVKAQLTLEVILADDGGECGVHKGGSC